MARRAQACHICGVGAATVKNSLQWLASEGLDLPVATYVYRKKNIYLDPSVARLQCKGNIVVHKAAEIRWQPLSVVFCVLFALYGVYMTLYQVARQSVLLNLSDSLVLKLICSDGSTLCPPPLHCIQRRWLSTNLLRFCANFSCMRQRPLRWQHHYNDHGNTTSITARWERDNNVYGSTTTTKVHRCGRMTLHWLAYVQRIHLTITINSIFVGLFPRIVTTPIIWLFYLLPYLNCDCKRILTKSPTDISEP